MTSLILLGALLVVFIVATLAILDVGLGREAKPRPKAKPTARQVPPLSPTVEVPLESSPVEQSDAPRTATGPALSERRGVRESTQELSKGLRRASSRLVFALLLIAAGAALLVFLAIRALGDFLNRLLS